MLFIVFVPYAMLPLSLGWCIVIGVLSSVAHVLATAVEIKELMDNNYLAVSLTLHEQIRFNLSNARKTKGLNHLYSSVIT